MFLGGYRVTEVKMPRNYIDGKWVESRSAETVDVVNPASGEVLLHVPQSTREELDHAAQAAQDALHDWSSTAVPKRSRILFKYQQISRGQATAILSVLWAESRHSTSR